MEDLSVKELEKLLSKKKKQKKKSDFSKAIVLLVILLNVAFTGAVLYVFLRVGSEPITLIGAWFAFTVGELWILKDIKKAKVKREKLKEEYFNE